MYSNSTTNSPARVSRQLSGWEKSRTQHTANSLAIFAIHIQQFKFVLIANRRYYWNHKQVRLSFVMNENKITKTWVNTFCGRYFINTITQPALTAHAIHKIVKKSNVPYGLLVLYWSFPLPQLSMAPCLFICLLFFVHCFCGVPKRKANKPVSDGGSTRTQAQLKRIRCGRRWRPSRPPSA